MAGSRGIAYDWRMLDSIALMNRHRRGPSWVVLSALVALTGCSGEDPEQPPTSLECVDPELAVAVPVVEALASLDGLAFDAFMDASHGQLLLRSPEQITDLDIADELGVRHDQLDDLSIGHIEGTYDLAAGILERLRAFDRAQLTEQQQHSYDVYEWYLDNLARHRQVRHFDYPVSHFLGAVHNNLWLFLRDVHPLRTRAEADDYIARLRHVGRKLDQVGDLLEENRALGVVPPRQLLEWALPQLGFVADASGPRSLDLHSRFMARVQDIPGLTADERIELDMLAATAIECHVIPGYDRLRSSTQAVLASAPSEPGVGQYQGGDAFYEYALRRHTTTELTAAEIHQLGLDESARIQQEMSQYFGMLGYPPGDPLDAQFQRIINDSALIQAPDVVTEYERLIDEAEMRLSQAFHRSPPIDVVVIGGAGGGYYVAGNLDGSRPGAFYAYADGPVPSYGMPTLTYHETVPGHHLQISLAQELVLPTIHQATHFTAYIEGWALYAEQLAAELGWYTGDIYGDLGRLQAEAFRAARLVVDTGIHSQGWTFDEAVDFMVENVGYSRSSMEGQIARYMAWPGQATAYKVGHLRFLELRQQAQLALDTSFDLRDFHAAVLDSGSLPLSLLDGVVDDWIIANTPAP